MGYGDAEISVKGRCIATVYRSNKAHKVLCYVVETNRTPLLGLRTCVRLNLIKRVIDNVNLVRDEKIAQLVEEFKDTFDEIGTLKRTYKMVLKDDATPIISPTRRIPYALNEKVKEEIARMLKLGVIERIPENEPTDWLNTMVVAHKPNGKVRICLDPRNLNKVIKREHFQLPTAEQIMAKMSGSNYFSKLDASSGYWQIPVDANTSKLLAFMSPEGRFRFNRLPFGIHSASEIFQGEIAQIINGLEGVDNSQDDIIVWAETKEELLRRLRAVLERIRESGLKLNKSKCEFGKQEVTFLGHVISKDGIKPDPAKTQAITNMPVPKTKEELQRFLGMVKYLGKFIPDLSTISTPLRDLLKKDIIFNMEKPQIEAINKLKEIITSEPVLKFYDPNLEVRIRSDASTEGLGGLLEQKHGDIWHPVAYASRSLKEAEKQYAAIEAEALSVVFACEKFHEYVYGRSFTVQNDHKPLESIFRKSITSCPLRIQRFMLRLQKYNFTLEHASGTTMKVADALSRASINDDDAEISDEEMKYYVNSVISTLPISESKMKQLQSETEKDVILKEVKKYVLEGWPNKVQTNVAQYRNIRDELSYAQGVLLKGDRMIIPRSMRQEIKTAIHTGHLGMEKCINRAKLCVYWPGMRKEIEDLVSNCSTCITYQNAQQRETLIEHEIPSAPWIKVGVDLFSLFGENYIIIVDYYSKYVDVSHLRNETAACVINNTKKTFSRYGIPKLVFSDNGSQFTSEKFKRFEKEWDFSHDTSSPEFPKSNGFVERHIQTTKNVLKKTRDSGGDPYEALLALNTTPDENGHSPASKMFNKQLRTNLPSIKRMKSGPVEKKQDVKTKYDERSKDLTEIAPGTTVRLFNRDKNEGNWRRKGKIISKRKEHRAYNVMNDRGNVVRRNRWQIRPTKEDFEMEDEYDDDFNYMMSQSTDMLNDNNDNDTVETGEPNDETYVTRSGRESRPPDRYGYT